MKIGQHNQRLNSDCVWDFFEWVLLVDMVVEEDAIQVVDFVLENDRVKTKGNDLDVFAFECVISFDGDLVRSIGVAWVFAIDAKAPFAIDEVALSDRLGNDDWINELILDIGAIFFPGWVIDDEHTLIDTDLRRS